MTQAAAKARMGYECSVPRCETCTHWTKPAIVTMRESLPTWSVPWCELGGFSAKRTAVCDHWRNNRGDTLQGSARQPAAAPVQPAEVQA